MPLAPRRGIWYNIARNMARDIKRAARKFTEYWLLGKESEVASYQKFWLSLLGDVLGAEDAIKRIKFEVPVPMGNTTKYIDGWISETKVLIEQKTRGIKLSAPQSGHGGKTPYEQALEYNNVRDSEIPPLDEGIKSLILI